MRPCCRRGAPPPAPAPAPPPRPDVTSSRPRLTDSAVSRTPPQRGSCLPFCPPCCQSHGTGPCQVWPEHSKDWPRAAPKAHLPPAPKRMSLESPDARRSPRRPGQRAGCRPGGHVLSHVPSAEPPASRSLPERAVPHTDVPRDVDPQPPGCRVHCRHCLGRPACPPASSCVLHGSLLPPGGPRRPSTPPVHATGWARWSCLGAAVRALRLLASPSASPTSS